MPRRRWAGTLAGAAVAALLVAGVPGRPAALDAQALEPSVQAQIDAQMITYPGGRQINANEVSYDSGRLVITFSRPQHGIAANPDCPSGRFCLYDGIKFAYPRASLLDCGWFDLTTVGWHNRAESVHYNKSSGSVSFIDHGSEPDHSGDFGVFAADIIANIDDDVSPYRNTADHTNSFC